MVGKEELLLKRGIEVSKETEITRKKMRNGGGVKMIRVDSRITF
jgi:hypothetical protein